MSAVPLPLFLIALAIAGVYLFLVALTIKRTELDRKNWLYPAWLTSLAVAVVTFDPTLQAWVDLPKTLLLILILYHLGHVEERQTERDLALTTLGYLFTYLALATHEGRFGPEILLPALNLTLLLHALILYLRAGPNRRWAVKYLVGAVFLTTGFQGLGYLSAWVPAIPREQLIHLQPLAYLGALPFIVLFIARTPRLGLKLHISRHAAHLAIFLITTLAILHGLYLLHHHTQLLAGSVGQPWWGYVVLALLMPLLGLAVVKRTSIKSFINQHFYNFKYDYRDSWLQVTKRLSTAVGDDRRLQQTALEIFSETFDCPQRALWLRQGPGYALVSHHDQHFPDPLIPPDDPAVRFLNNWQWIIDIDEYQRDPSLYPGLHLPPWLMQATPAVWLVIPLLMNAELYGFVTLGHSRSRRRIDWEDIDLAKTIGRQITISLLQSQNARQLAEAKQFSAYTKLATYVIHDLKNIISQLDLINRNYHRYKNNPEFIEDMHHTLTNAVEKMRHLVSRVTATTPGKPRQDPIDLNELLQRLRQRYRHHPKAGVEIDIQPTPDPLPLRADREKLHTILTNLIDNAIDAIDDQGRVHVHGERHPRWILIHIQDNGVGMTEEFIRERLFKPFETTKGTEGMGIGMYEAREYIESLGGLIHVRSAPGKGTTITLRLPA